MVVVEADGALVFLDVLEGSIRSGRSLSDGEVDRIPEPSAGLVNGTARAMLQEYKEEYDLKPAYAKLGEMLGMDMKKSLPREQKYQK